MRIIRNLSIVCLLVCLLTGCGVLRSLTTKAVDFDYAIPSQLIESSIGNQGNPLVVSTNVTISGDLVTQYDKYNGRIGWTGLEYTASFIEGEEVTVRFHASLLPNEPNPTEIPAEAILIEEIALSATQPTKSNIASSQNSNEELKRFITDSLRATSGSFKVYLFFEVESSTGGRLELSDMRLKGRAYGSLF